MTKTERSANSVPSLQVKSNAGDNADVILWADPSTHRLLVQTSTSISGGGLTNDDAAPGSDHLGALVAVANASAPSWTEGNEVLLSTDLSGALRVTGSLSVGGTTDEAAYTPTSSTGTPAMAAVDDVTPDSAAEGKLGILRMSGRRELYIQLRDAAGNERGLNVDASGQIAVTVASGQTIGLAAGTNGIGKLTANSGVTIGAVEIAAAQTLATVSTVTSVTQFNGNAIDLGNGAVGTGTLRVTIASDTTGVLSIDDNSGSITVDNNGTFAVQAAGDVAHDAADSGNPVKVGAKAIAALSGATLVSAADRTDAQSDLDGAIIVRDGYALGDGVQGAASVTDTTATSVISAPGANVYLYITDIQVANTGATAVLVTFQLDPAGTPSTLAYTIAPAGGGSNIHFGKPLKVTTANKAFGFTAGGSTTTLYVSAQGYKSKI